MAIKFISSAWKTNLETQFPPAERVYFDPRQKVFPPLPASTGYTFSAVTSGDNRPGSHNMLITSGDRLDVLIPMQSKFTFDFLYKPDFAYDTGGFLRCFAWFIDGTHRLRLMYSPGSDTFVLTWHDGGSEKLLQSQQFDDGSSHTDL